MRGISVKLRFKVDKHWTTRGEFLVGDGLLKFCVAFVHFGVECSGVKFFSGHCKLVDERKMKTAETLDGGIASGFAESRRAATCDKHCGHTEQNISTNRR